MATFVEDSLRNNLGNQEVQKQGTIDLPDIHTFYSLNIAQITANKTEQGTITETSDEFQSRRSKAFETLTRIDRTLITELIKGMSKNKNPAFYGCGIPRFNNVRYQAEIQAIGESKNYTMDNSSASVQSGASKLRWNSPSFDLDLNNIIQLLDKIINDKQRIDFWKYALDSNIRKIGRMIEIMECQENSSIPHYDENNATLDGHFSHFDINNFNSVNLNINTCHNNYYKKVDNKWKPKKESWRYAENGYYSLNAQAIDISQLYQQIKQDLKSTTLKKHETPIAKLKNYEKVRQNLFNTAIKKCSKDILKNIHRIMIKKKTSSGNKSLPKSYNFLTDDLKIGDILNEDDNNDPWIIIDIFHERNKRYFKIIHADYAPEWFMKYDSFDDDSDDNNDDSDDNNDDSDDNNDDSDDDDDAAANPTFYIINEEDIDTFYRFEDSLIKYTENDFETLVRNLEKIIPIFYKNIELEHFIMKSKGIDTNTYLPSKRIMKLGNGCFSNYRLRPDRNWLKFAETICFSKNNKEQDLLPMLLNNIQSLADKFSDWKHVIRFEMNILNQAKKTLFCSKENNDMSNKEHQLSDLYTFIARYYLDLDGSILLKENYDTLTYDQKRKEEDRWKFATLAHFSSSKKPSDSQTTMNKINGFMAISGYTHITIIKKAGMKKMLDKFLLYIDGNTIVRKKEGAFDEIKHQISKFRLMDWPLVVSRRYVSSEHVIDDMLFGEISCESDIPEHINEQIDNLRKHWRPYFILDYGYDIREKTLRDKPTNIHNAETLFDEMKLEAGDTSELVLVDKRLKLKDSSEILQLDEHLPIVTIPSIMRGGREFDHHTVFFEGNNAMGQYKKGFATILVVRKEELHYYVQKYASPHTYFMILPERKMTENQVKKMQFFKDSFLLSIGKNIIFKDLDSGYIQRQYRNSVQLNKWLSYKKLIERRAYSAGDSKHYCFAIGKKCCEKYGKRYIVIMDDQVESLMHQICKDNRKNNEKGLKKIELQLNNTSAKKINGYIRDVQDLHGNPIFNRFIRHPLTHYTLFKYMVEILKGLDTYVFLGMKSYERTGLSRKLWAKSQTNCVWMFDINNMKQKTSRYPFLQSNPLLCNLPAAEDLFMHIIFEKCNLESASLNTIAWKKTIGDEKTGTAGRSLKPTPYTPLWRFLPLISCFSEKADYFSEEMIPGLFYFNESINLTDSLQYDKKENLQDQFIDYSEHGNVLYSQLGAPIKVNFKKSEFLGFLQVEPICWPFDYMVILIMPTVKLSKAGGIKYFSAATLYHYKKNTYLKYQRMQIENYKSHAEFGIETKSPWTWDGPYSKRHIMTMTSLNLFKHILIEENIKKHIHGVINNDGPINDDDFEETWGRIINTLEGEFIAFSDSMEQKWKKYALQKAIIHAMETNIDYSGLIDIDDKNNNILACFLQYMQENASNNSQTYQISLGALNVQDILPKFKKEILKFQQNLLKLSQRFKRPLAQAHNKSKRKREFDTKQKLPPLPDDSEESGSEESDSEESDSEESDSEKSGAEKSGSEESDSEKSGSEDDGDELKELGKRKRSSFSKTDFSFGNNRLYSRDTFEICRTTLKPEDFKMLLHSRNLEKMKEEDVLTSFFKSKLKL